MLLTRLVILGAILLSAAKYGFAGYPDAPIFITVPFAAGTPSDTIGRNLAVALQDQLGQPVIIENVAGGGGGRLGAERVRRKKNDGHTLLLHNTQMSSAPTLYRRLPFKPQEDFEPIGVVANVPMILVARSNFPADNFKELLSYLKSNRNKHYLVNAGIGSASYHCGLQLMSAIESDLVVMPYKNTEPALSDVVNRVEMKEEWESKPSKVDLFMCELSTHTIPLIKEGKLKAFAVASHMRLPALPNVPTLDEEGLSGFDVTLWHALYAPKGTPSTVIDKISAALREVLKNPDEKNRFNNLGIELVPPDKGTPESLRKLLKSESDRWGALIQKSGQFAD